MRSKASWKVSCPTFSIITLTRSEYESSRLLSLKYTVYLGKVVSVHLEHRRGVEDESNEILRDPSKGVRQEVLELGQNRGSLLDAEEVFAKIGLIDEIHHLLIGMSPDNGRHNRASRGARYDPRKKTCEGIRYRKI